MDDAEIAARRDPGSRRAGPGQPPGAASRAPRWWARRPFSGIGFATGTRSGRLVLDIDPRHGGHLALQELERRHGVLPHTPFVLTGGGGGHYHFALPAEGAAVRSRVIAPGLELKGEGTLCVLPPSRHASGRDYAWAAGAEPTAENPLAEMPDWLLGGENLTPQPLPSVGRGSTRASTGALVEAQKAPSPRWGGGWGVRLSPPHRSPKARATPVWCGWRGVAAAGVE